MIQKAGNLAARFRQLYQRIGLGTKLTAILLPLVLIPMLIIAGTTYQRAREILRQQAIDQLTSAAHSQITVLTEWTETREQQLWIGSQRRALQEPLAVLIEANNVARVNATTRSTARDELENLKTRQGQVIFVDVLVARVSDGMILASTQVDQEGQALPSILDASLTGETIQSKSIYDDPLLAADTLAIVSMVPLRSAGGAQIDSLLIGVNSGLRIGGLMQDMQVFWEQRGVYRVERGETYMVYAPDVILRMESYGTSPLIESGVDHPVFTSVETAPSGLVEYTGTEGEAMLAGYEWLPDWNLGVVVELPQADIFAGINALAPFIAVLLFITIALVVLTVPFATGRAIRPLVVLTSLAERIARGEWRHRVPVISQDEIGRLGTSFNRMIAELEESYRSLEDRVRERTQQIRTASEVARDAIAIREPQTLLNEVVDLISERFGFYHAGVFIVDESGENAVLRAASSQGGKRMLQRGHSLPVGKVGIVGFVTGTGKPRIALDVGADAYHFANPDLPETRSEMALPLHSGDEIIGALDVQSTEPNAFSEEDTLVLQTMADQLAVAIENARLLEDQALLAGRRRTVIDIYHRLSTQLSYSQLLEEIPDIVLQGLDFMSVSLALVEADEVIVRSSAAMDNRHLVQLGDSMPIGRGIYGRAVSMKSPIVIVGTAQSDFSPAQSSSDESLTTICVPLLARGEVIGALAVTSEQPSHPQESDLEVLELLSGQIAVALENARLFEEMEQSLLHVDALLHQQTSEAWDELLDTLTTREEGSIIEYSRGFTSSRLPAGAPEVETNIALRGEIIGKLNILRKSSEEWSEDDLAILEAVSEEVASALEQARLMEELQRRATQLRTAAEIARDATGLFDVDTLFRRAVNLIHDRFGYQHVSVYLLDDKGEQVVIRESTGEVGRALKAQGHSVPVGSQSIVGIVAQSGEYYVAHDVSIDPYFRSNSLLPDTQTELGVPLKIGDQVIGTLDVQHNHPHAFSLDDIFVLEVLADQLAVAVQNARNFEEALQRAKREQAVMEITSKIRASSDVETMLRTAAQEIRHLLGARRARIHLAEVPLDLQTDGNGAFGHQEDHQETASSDVWPESMSDEGDE